MKDALRAFLRVLGSLSRRIKRVEDNQLVAHSQSVAKLDIIIANQDAIIKLLSPIARELETLPETVELVYSHDEWIRKEDERKRTALKH